MVGWKVRCKAIGIDTLVLLTTVAKKSETGKKECDVLRQDSRRSDPNTKPFLGLVVGRDLMGPMLVLVWFPFAPPLHHRYCHRDLKRCPSLQSMLSQMLLPHQYQHKR
eukprot:2158605-Amphidinium_carterae.1